MPQRYSCMTVHGSNLSYISLDAVHRIQAKPLTVQLFTQLSSSNTTVSRNEYSIY